MKRFISSLLLLAFTFTMTVPSGWADEPHLPLQGPQDPDPAVSIQRAQALADAEAAAFEQMLKQAAAFTPAPGGSVSVSYGSATPGGVILTLSTSGPLEARGHWGDGAWGGVVTVNGRS